VFDVVDTAEEERRVRENKELTHTNANINIIRQIDLFKFIALTLGDVCVLIDRHACSLTNRWIH
jgi:hypothetical protein